jgi:hypothetical protein
VPLPAEVFTQRQILRFWLPLAASWLLMGSEGPILQAAIARLADMQTQIAAFGIVMSIEITVESPVIMLLATSTALVNGAHSYRVVRRFMLLANLVATVGAGLAAFTPVFDVVVLGVMGIPPPIAAAARPGMKIMTVWSALIGWRRFYQGIMIRRGQTHWVGYGTLTRLVTCAGTAVLLALATRLTGVAIAAIGLVAGVAVEAAFATWVARGTVSRLAGEGEASGTVTMRDVFRYHAPLAATSFMTLLAQPLIGAGLARMPGPADTLAAWPVVWGVLFIFRSPAFALPEAVIALVTEQRLLESVRRFCRRVGAASALALALLAATPLVDLYLQHVAGLPDRLARFVVPGLLLGTVLPLLNARHSWFRGLLMAARATGVIYWGMGLNLMVMAAAVGTSVLLQLPGVVAAVAALVVSLLAEIAFLRPRAAAAAVAEHAILGRRAGRGNR